MAPYSSLKIMHAWDRDAAVTKILSAIEQADGSITGACRILGVNYVTLNRIRKKDIVLAKQIAKLKERLHGEGIRQLGWGKWHKERTSGNN